MGVGVTWVQQHLFAGQEPAVCWVRPLVWILCWEVLGKSDMILFRGKFARVLRAWPVDEDIYKGKDWSCFFQSQGLVKLVCKHQLRWCFRECCKLNESCELGVTGQIASCRCRAETSPTVICSYKLQTESLISSPSANFTVYDIFSPYGLRSRCRAKKDVDFEKRSLLSHGIMRPFLIENFPLIP